MGEYAHVKKTPGPTIQVGPLILQLFILEFQIPRRNSVFFERRREIRRMKTELF